MNKDTYLEMLDFLLSDLSYNDRRDIMYDYEMHFEESLNEGKTEEEIITALNKPEVVAAKYVDADVSTLRKKLEARHIKTAETVIKPVAIMPTKTNVVEQPIPVKKKANHVVVMIVFIILLLILTGILISPYILFWMIPIMLFSIAVAGMFGGFALLLSSIVTAPLAFFGFSIVAFEHPIFFIALSIAIITFGGLCLIATYYVSKALSYVAFYYFKWCFRAVRGY